MPCSWYRWNFFQNIKRINHKQLYPQDSTTCLVFLLFVQNQWLFQRVRSKSTSKQPARIDCSPSFASTYAGHTSMHIILAGPHVKPNNTKPLLPDEIIRAYSQPIWVLTPARSLCSQVKHNGPTWSPCLNNWGSTWGISKQFANTQHRSSDNTYPKFSSFVLCFCVYE